MPVADSSQCSRAVRGDGNALAAGFAQLKGDIVVMLDADGPADPTENRLVEALKAGSDSAKGSRFTADGGSADITRFRRLDNRFPTAAPIYLRLAKTITAITMTTTASARNG